MRERCAAGQEGRSERRYRDNHITGGNECLDPRNTLVQLSRCGEISFQRRIVRIVPIRSGLLYGAGAMRGHVLDQPIGQGGALSSPFGAHAEIADKQRAREETPADDDCDFRRERRLPT